MTALPQRAEQFLFGAFLAVLVWAPFPFASNRPWSAALLCALLFALLLAWFLLYGLNRVDLPGPSWRAGRVPLALLCLVQIWVLLQLLPAPLPLLQLISPQAALWQSASETPRISLDPQATKFYLFKGVALCSGFFLTLVLVRSAARMRWFMGALVLVGTVQAFYGALMVLSGVEWGFFVEKYASRGSATGTYVNRNHLAGLLVMCLAAGTGLLLSQMNGHSSRSLREALRDFLALLLSPRIRLRIYLAIMVVGLVLTRSRMGNISFFIALAAAGGFALFSGRRFSWRVAAFLLSLFVVDVLILGKWFGFDKVVQRLQETEIATEQRVWSNEYTLDMISAFPLTGSGGGSFASVFPNFQSPQLEGFHLHAHNDYLQFAAELGVPIVLLLAGFVLLCLWQACRVQRQRRTPLYRGAGFSVVMTITWVLVHSTTDFNLQIPANALIFVTLLALAPLATALPAEKPIN